MCLACAATSDALLSALEREVVLAEAEAGLGDPAARRPLSAAERRAMVRFGEITALEEEYLAAVVPVLEELRGVVDGEILAALAGAGSATALMGALEALITSQPSAVTMAAQEAAVALAGALETVYTGSSTVAIGEAARQGVTALPQPLAPTPGTYQAAAQRLALEPYQRALEVARKEITNPQVLIGEVLDADLVPMALSRYDQAGAVDLARQFAHSAIGGGRNDTFQAIPEPSYYYASELLDGRGCSRCAAVDQREYLTLQEALADYGSGVYRACEGAFRCRGVLVRVFE